MVTGFQFAVKKRNVTKIAVTVWIRVESENQAYEMEIVKTVKDLHLPTQSAFPVSWGFPFESLRKVFPYPFHSYVYFTLF